MGSLVHDPLPGSVGRMALIVLALCGLCLIVAGSALIYPPAALIVAGVACVTCAYLIAEEGK